jgi:hypothetical protein
MEVGLKRTTIARIAAGLGCLCGAIALWSSIVRVGFLISPNGWGTGGTMLLLLALYVLVDGVVSFEKSRLNVASKH